MVNETGRLLVFRVLPHFSNNAVSGSFYESNLIFVKTFRCRLKEKFINSYHSKIQILEKKKSKRDVDEVFDRFYVTTP